MTNLKQMKKDIDFKKASKLKTNGIPKTFPKSRVPVSFILDYFKEGLTKHDFHYSYPWIKTKDIDSVIAALKQRCLI